MLNIWRCKAFNGVKMKLFFLDWLGQLRRKARRAMWCEKSHDFRMWQKWGQKSEQWVSKAEKEAQKREQAKIKLFHYEQICRCAAFLRLLKTLISPVCVLQLILIWKKSSFTLINNYQPLLTPQVLFSMLNRNYT